MFFFFVVLFVYAVTNLDWIGWTGLASSSGSPRVIWCAPLSFATPTPPTHPCPMHLYPLFWCLAGIGKLSTADGKAFADPEVLRRLTSSVSCALDEAAAALTRMRAENTLNAGQADKYVSRPYRQL